MKLVEIPRTNNTTTTISFILIILLSSSMMYGLNQDLGEKPMVADGEPLVETNELPTKTQSQPQVTEFPENSSELNRNRSDHAPELSNNERTIIEENYWEKYEEPGFQPLTKGTLTIESRDDSSSIDSGVQVWSVDNEGQFLERIHTESTGEDGILSLSLQPGYYRVKVFEATTQESDLLRIRLGEETTFTASFTKLTFNPYDFSKNTLTGSFALLDQNGAVIENDIRMTSNEQLVRWVNPGTYQLISHQNSYNARSIDAYTNAVIPVLIDNTETSNSAIALDDVSFGELVVHANTTYDMPLRASVRVYNSTDGTQVTSGSMNASGMISFTLAPYNYDVKTYFSHQYLSVYNDTISVIGQVTTDVYVTFSHFLLYSDEDIYVYLYNSTSGSQITYTRMSTDTRSFFLPADQIYDVEYRYSGSSVWYTDISPKKGELIEFGTRIEKDPFFKANPSYTTRVLANENSTVTVSVWDENFDHPLTLNYFPNLGTVTELGSKWIDQFNWQIQFNYTAPSFDDTYKVVLGLVDGNGYYSNFTQYLSNRETDVTYNTTGYNDRPLDNYVYAIEVHTGDTTYIRTLDDGLGTLTVYDGDYYFRINQDIDYYSPDRFINQTYGPYYFEYSFAEVVFNTTSKYEEAISTSVRVYNASQSLSNNVFNKPTNSSGLSSAIVPEYTNFAFRSYASTPESSIWKKNVWLLAGERPVFDFKFGVLAVYVFDENDDPMDVYTYLYNATSSKSSSITYQRTLSDGISVFTLAPYDNYSVRVNLPTDEWFDEITVVESQAVVVGDFVNAPPVISGIVASPDRIGSDESTVIMVSASDIDPIDKLDYIWTSNVGSISGSGDTINFTSPGFIHFYEVFVNVSDQFGGWDNISIVVSNQQSSIDVTVKRGNAVDVDTYVYLQQVRTGDTEYVRTLADGQARFSNIYDDYYEIYTTQDNRITFSQTINASLTSSYFIDFEFADIVMNTTTRYGEVLGTSVYFHDTSTGDIIRSGSTGGSTGLHTFVVRPDTYDLRAQSSNTPIWHRDKTLAPLEATTFDFRFAQLNFQINSTYYNPRDNYVYLYNQSETSSLAYKRTLTDGYDFFNVAPGNYSLRFNVNPDYRMYNLTVAENDEKSIDLILGTLIVYTNDGSTPTSETVRVYPAGETNQIVSQTTSSTVGTAIFHLMNGTYDVKIGSSTWYYDVVINMDARTEVGIKLNVDPKISWVTASPDRIGSSATTTVTVAATDADYDYRNLAVSLVTSTGTISNLYAQHGFISTDEFRVTFDYTSPDSGGVYQINITLSDGSGGTDFYVLYVSNNNNHVYLNSYILDDQHLDTTVRIYDHQTGSQTASATTSTTGTIVEVIPDGWYDIEFREGNSIWFNSMVIAGGSPVNVSAYFGVAEVYAVGSGGQPLDAYVYVKDIDTGNTITYQRTLDDGLAIFYLAPGTYDFEIQQDNAITIRETLMEGTRVIVGSDNPTAISMPDDLTYEYGTTGHSLSWTFGESDPHKYNITRNGTLVIQGDWDGSEITILVDGLDIGLHVYEIWVNDTNGLPNYDMVNVHVEPPSYPVTGSPADIQLEFGTSGSIEWHSGSNIPDYYRIYLDSTVIESGVWDGGDISIDLSGLSLGTYTYTVWVNDTMGQEASDSVMVIVEDTTPPTTSGPSDITYYEGQTGNEIEWKVSDPHPDSYSILKDGTQIESGTWTSGVNISVNIDGLTTGAYNYTLVVEDTQGNWIVHSVMVTVEMTPDTVAPNITNPSDFSYEEGTTGNEIEWTATDDHPDDYVIYLDGIQETSGMWISGQPITISADGMSVGTHNYTIVVFDQSGNSAQDTVMVSVMELSSSTSTSTSSATSTTSSTSTTSPQTTGTDTTENTNSTNGGFISLPFYVTYFSIITLAVVMGIVRERSRRGRR